LNLCLKLFIGGYNFKSPRRAQRLSDDKTFPLWDNTARLCGMCILDSDLLFIRQLYSHSRFVSLIVGGNSLKTRLTLKQRKDLETKMTKALKQNMKALTTELQRILVDDMVTAFQNRINVLNRAQTKRTY